MRTVGSETYDYDPMDYRIGRSGGSLGNRSFFLEGEHLESEYSGSQLQARYFRGSTVDELVAAWMFDTDGKLKPYLFHQDQVSSSTEVSGHNGGTTQATRYSAFGQTQTSTGANPNRLKYTGREDDGTELMYYRARYYDSSIGRFISEDPMGFDAGDVNFYAYVNNNPVNANDPMGFEAVIARNGNQFNIQWQNANVRVLPPLNPAAAAAAMSANVSGAWSGSFPPYTSTASVNYQLVSQFPTTTNPSAINVTIRPGNGSSSTTRGGLNGATSIEIFMGAHRNAPAHEFGHDLGLEHPLNGGGNVVRGSNIMMYPPVGAADTRRPDASNFNDILRNSLTGSGPPVNTSPRRDEPAGWDFTGAAGGFLLYPNKPNNNSSQVVYSK